MQINIGDIVQTPLYARGKYAGRKMRVSYIQSDVEHDEDLLLGVCVKRNGSTGKTKLQCKRKDAKLTQ